MTSASNFNGCRKPVRTRSDNHRIEFHRTILYGGHGAPEILLPNGALHSLEAPSEADDYQRSSFRTTSFSPDQTSVTAHTLMSTKPSGRATSRTVSSVMSVGTFAAFFGQDTHTTAVGLSLPL